MLFWIWLQGCKVIHYIINWRGGWSWPWVKRFLESAPGLIITGFVRPDVQIISSKWNDDVPVHIGPKYNLRKTKLERRIISFSNQMYHLHLLTERSWQYALSLVSFVSKYVAGLSLSMFFIIFFRICPWTILEPVFSHRIWRLPPLVVFLLTRTTHCSEL